VLSAGGVDASHQRWELDKRALISPDAIICTGLLLEEGAGRHFRQSAAQHQRILALLKAIGPASYDGSDNTRDSGMDAVSSLENAGVDAAPWLPQHDAGRAAGSEVAADDPRKFDVYMYPSSDSEVASKGC
jgi:hypothetical protein